MTSSIQATLDCAKRLRAMSPDFLTPIFYFKPYPGSAIVIEAVARGFSLPDTLEAWARIRLSWPAARSVGLAGEIPTDRALQVLPRAGLEARYRAASASAAARALSLRAATTIAGRSRCCLQRWLVPAQKLS